MKRPRDSPEGTSYHITNDAEGWVPCEQTIQVVRDELPGSQFNLTRLISVVKDDRFRRTQRTSIRHVNTSFPTFHTSVLVADMIRAIGLTIVPCFSTDSNLLRLEMDTIDHVTIVDQIIFTIIQISLACLKFGTLTGFDPRVFDTA